MTGVGRQGGVWGGLLSLLFKTRLQKQINSPGGCLDWRNCIDNLLKCREMAYFPPLFVEFDSDKSGLGQ